MRSVKEVLTQYLRDSMKEELANLIELQLTLIREIISRDNLLIKNFGDNYIVHNLICLLMHFYNTFVVH